MDREQYADLNAVPDAVVMERLGELQGEADAAKSQEEDAKEQAKEHRKTWERHVEKMALIHRARKAGKTLRMLKGGELTDEEPELETLFEGQGAPAEAVETPATKGPPEPEDDAPLVIHTATGPNGEPCEVRRQDDGKWWGRVAGKPVALGLATSKAAKAEVLGIFAAGTSLTWFTNTPPPTPAV